MGAKSGVLCRRCFLPKFELSTGSPFYLSSLCLLISVSSNGLHGPDLYSFENVRLNTLIFSTGVLLHAKHLDHFRPSSRRTPRQLPAIHDSAGSHCRARYLFVQVILSLVLEFNVLDLPTRFGGWGWSCNQDAWRESTHFFTMLSRCGPYLFNSWQLSGRKRGQLCRCWPYSRADRRRRYRYSVLPVSFCTADLSVRRYSFSVPLVYRGCPVAGRRTCDKRPTVTSRRRRRRFIKTHRCLSETFV